MKIKDLIEELKRYNPDGSVYITVFNPKSTKLDDDQDEVKAINVRPQGCGYIDVVIE